MHWTEKLEQKHTVLIVDRHVSTSQLLTHFLGSQKGFSVIVEAKSGTEALRRYQKYKPDLVILALELPELNGPDVIWKMKAERDAKFFIYSGTQNPVLIRAAFATQPHGFVHKSEDLETLYQGIRMVTDGVSYFSPFATELRSLAASTERLTAKERMILQLVAEGQSSKQAAQKMSLSPKTVEHYRKNLMRKLELNCVASLTLYAVRCGLVSASNYTAQSRLPGLIAAIWPTLCFMSSITEQT